MIGIHVSLWTPEWDAPFLGHIRTAANLGFDSVEIPIMDPFKFPVDEVLGVLDETGMRVFCGTGLGPGTDISSLSMEKHEAGERHLLKCLDICDKLGSSSLQGVIHSAWGLQSAISDENREMSASILKRVARKAAENNQKISLECINRYESSFLNTVDQGLNLLDMIDEPNAGLHLDTYHMNIEENSITGAIKRAGAHLNHLHLSENQRGFPGSGLLDWDAIIRAAENSAYTGPWIIESYVFPGFATGKDVSIWRDIEQAPEESLKRSLGMLRELIDG